MKKKIKRKIETIAVLCSGGDAPGMNPALRAVVRTAIYHGLTVHGVFKGFTGLLEGQMQQLNLRSVANIIQRGGTVIKTDRCKAFFEKSARAEAAHILKRKGIDALIVIGGEGSYTGAYLLQKENGLPVVGLPGTIDNDIYGSEYSIGFDTAVNTAVEAIDKVRDTASAHDRVFIVEVMGRTSGEIATRVAISGGAEVIIVPDKNRTPLEAYPQVLQTLKKSARQGKLSSIVVSAECGLPGSTYQLAEKLKNDGGIDARVVVLGHIQRGGSPSAMDRYMSSVMGAKAIETLLKGRSSVSIGVVNGKVTTIPLKTTIGRHKGTDQTLLHLLKILSS